MPYRRLPNTDAQRFCALQACWTKAEATPAPEHPISTDNYTLLGTMFADFSAALAARGTSLSGQTGATAEYNSKFNIARQWISHFIQTLNLAIDRGVFPASARGFYLLDVGAARVPQLSSEADVMLWGQRLQTGEAARVTAGGAAIPFPTIAEVTTRFTAYDTIRLEQSEASEVQDENEEAVAAMRPAADALVKDLWDEIEFKFRHQSPSSLRGKAREWGVIYENRPGETPDEPLPLPGEAELQLEGASVPSRAAFAISATDAAYFIVFYRLLGAADFAELATNVPPGLYETPDLAAGDYEFKVRPVNATGEGPESNTASVTIA